MKDVVSIVLNNFINDSRVLKENISLSNNGYRVKIIALHENNLSEFERVKNIPVYRIKLKTRNWSKHKLVQLIKYIEFCLRVIRKFNKMDIIHCNDLNTLPVGVLIKLFYNKNVKIVYDAHEYETEINGLKGFQKYTLKKLEKALIKYADAVISVSDSIANEYVKLYNIEKPYLVLNTPSYQKTDKKDIFRDIFDIKKSQTIFLYQGGFSKGRGIELLLEAFQQEANSCIIFMGYGALENDIRDSAQKYRNIFFHEAVSPEVLLEYTSSADFGFLFYENNCLNHYYCSPNKIFEYIMAGIPVIVSNLYEMKRLVESNNIGIVVKDNSSDGIKDAVVKAETIDMNLFKKNIERVKEIYNWKNQERVLLKVYRDIYEN